MSALRPALALLGVALLVSCGSGGGGGGGGGQPDLPLLAQLEVSEGVLAPTFDPGTTDYSVGPATLASSVTVTATVADLGATLTVNGAATASGAPSAPIPLAPGTTVVTVVVTAPNGFTQHAYTVSFERTSADLVSLVASAGALSPSFAADETDYAVGPPLDATSSTVTATAADPGATVVVDGLVVPSGTPSPSFALGPHPRLVTVLVVPRAGFSKTYTLLFDRFEALFLEDFSDPELGPWWSSGGALDDTQGDPAPSLSFENQQSVDYVDDPFSSADGLSITVMVQRDVNARAGVRLFQAAWPENRWLSVELYPTGWEMEYWNDGAFVQSSQGPYAAQDQLFHLLDIRIDAAGQATFRWNGTHYATVNGVAVTDWQFTLDHPISAAAPGQLARFDDVTVTSP